MPGFNRIKRSIYERASMGLGRFSIKLGFTPNFWTAVSLLCAIISGYFFWQGNLILGIVMMLANAFTDMLDGSTARAANMGSAFGGILDHVSDRYGEFFILLGISISKADITHPGWGLFALFGMIIASYTRAAAESIGKIENCAVGIMGRLEKFLLIILGIILQIIYPDIVWLATDNFSLGWIETALIIVGIASFVTSIQRLAFASRILKQRKST